MYDYDVPGTVGKRAARAISDQLWERLTAFLTPLLTALDAHLDARLVRTLHATVGVFLQFRHPTSGLLLSELGGYLLGPDQAPAGTKRLSNLLRSVRWKAQEIADFFWRGADARLRELEERCDEPLLLWDDSVWEKPESGNADFCAVRSSHAARLKRSRPGCFNPPGGRPIFVPGLHWLAVLLLGRSGPPTVALMRWWRTAPREGRTTEAPTTEGLALRTEVLQACCAAWGRRVLHIFDRGFAGSPWLGELLAARARFVVRWPKRYHLRETHGTKRPAWQIVRGQKAWDEQWLRDTPCRTLRKVGVLAVCLQHPEHQPPLWLVVARSGRKEPWYLLTNEPVENAQQAWNIVLGYARRWQIEMAFRFGKSELALESPRLWKWESRQKLLLLVSLAYAFLLTLLQPHLAVVRERLLRLFCHRTGQRSRETPAPLYRLRSALSRLWLTHPRGQAQTPG